MDIGSLERVILIILALVIFIRQDLIAQDQKELRFGSITTEDGLSHSTVNSIAQDTFGFLWLGTMDGLNRYDGNLIEIFKNEKDDPSSINDNTVWEIFVSSKNEIWLGTQSGICIYSYESGQFSNITLSEKENSANGVRRIIEDEDGIIWAITQSEGLVKIVGNIKTGYSALAIQNTEINEDIKISQGHSGIALDPTRSHTIWIAHLKNLLSVDTKTNKMTFWNNLLESSNGELGFYNSPYVDSEGIVWVLSSDKGMYRVDIEERTVKQYRHSAKLTKSISGDGLFRMIEDSDQNLWISSLGTGLNVMRDRNKDEFDVYKMDPSKSNSLQSNNIVDLFEDRKGTIWFGTHGGGAQYFTQEKDPFSLYKFDKGSDVSIPSNNITSVFEDSRGNSWIGTRQEGITKAKFNASKSKINSIEIFNAQNPKSAHIQNKAAVSFFEDKELGLIIGIRLGGIQVYDYKSESFRSYFYQADDLDAIKSFHVNDIEITQDGDLFLGTFNGVYLWDRSAKQLINYNDSHPSLSRFKDSYVTFLKDDGDQLWIGTGGKGVHIWDKESKVLTDFADQYLNESSGPFESILSFYEDTLGNYWIGSWDGGLLKFNKSSKSINLYDESNGLNNKVIYSIQGDDEGMLWVSTNKGISKFDPKEERFYNFTKSDGLQGEEYNSRVGFTNSTSGHIFFGGMEGLNAFLPSEVNTDVEHPKMYINKMTVYEEYKNSEDQVTDMSVKEGAEVVINHNCYLMNFVIGAPILPKNDNVKYAYKLEGLSDIWFDLGKGQEFSLTNLPAGKYTLKIRSMLENGSLSPERAMLSIISLPPWWQTWWAYLLYAAFIIAVFYVIYQYRVGQLIKYQSLRTQISSDLHDDVGTILSTLAFQSEMMELEHKKINIEGFDKLSRLSRLAMGRMRDTVWAMDARRDNTESLLARMNDFLFDAFDHQEIEYKFNHSKVKEGIKVPPNIRQTIYLVFKESVTNALKHANGNIINIDLTLDARHYSLEVRDDGTVDPEKIKTSGLGLSNMRARADKIDAIFKIDTSNGFSVLLEKKV